MERSFSASAVSSGSQRTIQVKIGVSSRNWNTRVLCRRTPLGAFEKANRNVFRPENVSIRRLGWNSYDFKARQLAGASRARHRTAWSNVRARGVSSASDCGGMEQSGTGGMFSHSRAAGGGGVAGSSANSLLSGHSLAPRLARLSSPSIPHIMRPLQAVSDVSSPNKLANETKDSNTLEMKLKHKELTEGSINVRIFTQADKMRLSITTNLEETLLLHWGIVPRRTDIEEWHWPPREFWPPGTSRCTENSVQTRMVQQPCGPGSDKFQSTAAFDFELSRSPKALHFIFQNKRTGEWYKHPEHEGAFTVLLPGATTPAGGCEALKGLTTPTALDPALLLATASTDIISNTSTTVKKTAEKKTVGKAALEEKKEEEESIFSSFFGGLFDSPNKKGKNRQKQSPRRETREESEVSSSESGRSEPGAYKQLEWERGEGQWNETLATQNSVFAQCMVETPAQAQVKKTLNGWRLSVTTEMKGDLFLVWGMRRSQNKSATWVKPLKSAWPLGTVETLAGVSTASVAYRGFQGVFSPFETKDEFPSSNGSPFIADLEPYSPGGKTENCLIVNIGENYTGMNFVIYDKSTDSFYDNDGEPFTVALAASLPDTLVAETAVTKVASASDPPDIRSKKALELALRAKKAAQSAVTAAAKAEEAAEKLSSVLSDFSNLAWLHDLAPRPAEEVNSSSVAPASATQLQPEQGGELNTKLFLMEEAPVDELDAELTQTEPEVKSQTEASSAVQPQPPSPPSTKSSDFIAQATQFLNQNRPNTSKDNTSLLDSVTVKGNGMIPPATVSQRSAPTVIPPPPPPSVTPPPAPTVTPPAPTPASNVPSWSIPSPPPMPANFRPAPLPPVELKPVVELAPVAPPPPIPVPEKEVEAPAPPTFKELPKESGTGNGRELLLQGFNWESNKQNYYDVIMSQAQDIADMGFTQIWLPPPTDSVSDEGYMPRDLYNLNSNYGSEDKLREAITRLHDVGLSVLGDAVINHRCAHAQGPNGIWNKFGGKLDWDQRAIVGDDPNFQGRGNSSSGECFGAAPNIDHSQDFVRQDLCQWMQWLQSHVGYDGWRLDFVRGFWGGYVKEYMMATNPTFAVGEYWDSLSYSGSSMDYNQDSHRQRTINWINAAGGLAGAFDVTTKGILHATFENCEYWRLRDESGNPPGVMGWWPSRAVTFLENHDTGSTQGHWRFPGGKEAQGYAYILTHPGTPTVFYDHVFQYGDDLRRIIQKLINLRKSKGLHCRSQVKIDKAERDVYGAFVDEVLAVKLGPGWWEPGNGWRVAVEGNDFKVWERN